MKDLLDFAGEHPIVTVLIVWAICGVLKTLIMLPFRIANRYFRSQNIRAHGWPKAPIDADGDVVRPTNVEA